MQLLLPLIQYLIILRKYCLNRIFYEDNKITYNIVKKKNSVLP